nr:hypothetical protein [uncultured Noviherbaspirillum sp.]
MKNTMQGPTRREAAAALGCTLLLAGLFSQVEIQIEGPAGWAVNLPTWRIEQHWLLDIFFGGRPMTGYHAFVLPFIAVFFHFPVCFASNWTLRRECLVLACLIIFWIVEDFLWFATNPAFGLGQFNAASIPWHKHWLWFAPLDYWMFSAAAVALLYFSCSTSGSGQSSRQLPGYRQ